MIIYRDKTRSLLMRGTDRTDNIERKTFVTHYFIIINNILCFIKCNILEQLYLLLL